MVYGMHLFMRGIPKTTRISEYCAENNIRDWVSIRTLSQLQAALHARHELLFLPFFLHRLGERAGDALLCCLNQGCHIAILDYRIPERNLDYPSCAFHWFLEMLGDHFASYRAFMRAGGLEQVLFQCRQIPCVREVMHGGAASFVCLAPAVKFVPQA